MDKLTKIIATIGPVSDSQETIEELILAGVNVFRFNFKHSDVEWHNERIERVVAVAAKLGMPVGTLIDLQGPEIRINMPVEELEVAEGESLWFGKVVFEDASKKGLSISHPDIIPHLKDGQKILADDGAFEFKVSKKGEECFLVSETAGVLKVRKSMNIPGADFPFPVLIDRDFEGLKLAAKNNVDFVALSFVRTADDLRVVREEMKKNGVGGRLVAKIETEKAIANLEEIVAESDAVMVARGDLGVEMPIERIPYYQKLIIKKCIEAGKPVITATQMLESMIENRYPTRAEVSDIGNATYDFTDAVMLSGETATGKHAVGAVRVMAKTVAFNEGQFLEDTRAWFDFKLTDTEAVVCNSAYNLYLEMRKLGDKVAGFIVFTESGRTARLLSNFRPKVPICAFCPDRETAESLLLNFGVFPVIQGKKYERLKEVTRSQVLTGIGYLLGRKMIEGGKKYIVLHGDVWAREGGTSTVKVVTA